MTVSGVTWHGTQAETFALLQALSRNCSCEVTAEGERLKTCSAHRMLLEDQRALDGLVFVRRLRERLEAEEMSE